MRKEWQIDKTTKVIITDTCVKILRDPKLFSGGQMAGRFIFKLSALNGLIFNGANTLLFLGSGLPCPQRFNFDAMKDTIAYPNWIMGKPEDIKEIYKISRNYIEGINDKDSE